MKKKEWIIWLLIIILFLTAAGLAYHILSTSYVQKESEKESTEEKSVSKTTENKADDFTVYDESNNKVKLSDYIGTPLVVNFWASWCPPCKREMPSFQEAMNQYGEKVTFLMINETDGERETMDTAQTFWKDNGYQMKILFDLDGDAGNTYNLLYLPRTLFIDEKGNIVENHVGELSKTELEEALGKLLSQNKDADNPLDDYKNVSVTYTFGDTSEVLDNTTIMSWLKVKKSKVTVDEEKVKEYVAELASKYDTSYKKRTFQTHDGNVVEIDGNEYGYQIDQENEKQQLITDIQSKVPVQRELVYARKGLKRNGMDDLLGSYVEVNLEQQHLWLYKDGALVTETDIISGLPEDGRSTYKGAWPIAYKASPYTLSSEEYGYSTKVQYWIPFVCGQGLHDADWQTEFGGEVYKTKGSHGCINLPPAQAEVIYHTVEAGYPVIIY